MPLSHPDGVPRRDFVRRAGSAVVGALALPVLGCGGASAGPAPTASLDTVVITPGEVRIDLAGTPDLARVPGFLLVPLAAVIVLRPAAADYRAFSAVCTHAGCSVNRFADGRVHCPCHLSEFDVDGRPVAGPAPLPLTRLTVARAGDTLVVTRLTL